MTRIPHTAIIEIEAAILGAELIAFLLQPRVGERHFEGFVHHLCEYFQGKGGDTPTQGNLKEALQIQKAYQDYVSRQATGKEMRKKSILSAILVVYAEARALELTGDPEKDWKSLRRILENGQCPRLKDLAEETRNLRFLERGSQLRQGLAQEWKDNGAYSNAVGLTRQAFLQDYFSRKSRPETGVVVMNMDKAKGKQFDEVIIFEGWPKRVQGEIVANTDRIVRSNERANINEHIRQKFRVEVTRGKQHTTILTPYTDPCVLFVPKES
jgi:DNA helicase-2/ATP-dependent DNA helicase PcrA